MSDIARLQGMVDKWQTDAATLGDTLTEEETPNLYGLQVGLRKCADELQAFLDE